MKLNTESHSFAVFPGPKGLSNFGITYRFVHDTLNCLSELARDYGDTVSLSLYGKQTVAFFDPGDVHKLLLAPENCVNKAPLGKARSLKIGGEGIIQSDGEIHRLHRQIVMRSFSASNLKEYLVLMIECIQNSLSSWPINKAVDLVPMCRSISRFIASCSLFGTSTVTGSTHIIDAADRVAKTQDSGWRSYFAALIPYNVPGISNGKTVRDDLYLIDDWLEKTLIGGVIKDERCVANSLWAQGQQSAENWTIRKVRDNLLQLFMTGYDTTSASIVWTCYLLSQNPLICEQLYSEIQQQLKGQSLTYDDFEFLPYLDAVIRESLRIFPTGPFGFRVLLNNYQLGPYFLKKGTAILYSPWVTHRKAKYFKDPLRFLPERFMGNNKFDSGAYLPFGIGSRSCVGAQFFLLQIKAFLIILLQRYRLEIIPEQKINACFTGAVYPKPSLYVRVFPQDRLFKKSSARVYGNLSEVRCQPN